MNWKELIFGEQTDDGTVARDDEVEELDDESVEAVDDDGELDEEDQLTESELRQQAIEKAMALLNGPSEGDNEPLPEPSELDVERLLEGVDFEAMYASPEGMQSAFTGVVKTLVSQINELQKENISISRRAASRTLSLKEIADNFYDQNEDLQGFKPIMRLFANEVMKDEPGISPKALMEKAAEKTRAALFSMDTSSSEKVKKPAFPSKAKSKRGKTGKKKSKLQKEMDAMFGRG